MSELPYNTVEVLAMTPSNFRQIVRQNRWPEMAINCCRGYTQANLVILPSEMAGEFLLFCQRNPKPCPVLDVTERGSPHPILLAPEADLRTDLGKYRVFKEGKLIDEPTDIIKYWRDDLVAFMIGCSLSFDWSLRANNILYRMPGDYYTNIQCIPAGRFHGHMVVSCRIIEGSHNAIRAIQLSSRYPSMHGALIGIGDPKGLGIKDFCHPEFAVGTDPITLPKPTEIALYWACGITPQIVAVEAEVPFMITHYCGYMFVTDKPAEDFTVI